MFFSKSLKFFIFLYLFNSAVPGQVSEKIRPDAQAKPGKISGMIIDSSNGLPLEYANIIIYRQKDSTMMTGGITNPAGNFLIEDLSMGQYIVKIKFLGYSPVYVSNIAIKPNQTEINLGKIYLNMEDVSTGDVVITAEKDAHVHNLDKKVINVDKNFASAGGSAVDVLQNVPSVNVDVDGNVTMRGSSNLTILIDGKPSGMTALSSGDVLNQIPAEQIESIEIITNPSSKYDPEGTAGIINVLMKKKGVSGFNGQFSAFGGTGNKYNGSVILNYRLNGLNLNLSYDNRTNNFLYNSTNTRLSSLSLNSPALYQNVDGSMLMATNNLSFTADYTFNEKDNLSFTLRDKGHTFGYDTKTFIKNYNSSGILTSDYMRTSDGPRKMGAMEYSLDYKKVFEGPGHELTADITFTDFAMSRDEKITEVNYLGGTVNKPDQNTFTDNTSNMLILQSDYTRQISPGSKIDAGYKSTVRITKMRNDYETFNPIAGTWDKLLQFRNHFDMDEQVHAVYANYTGSVNDWFKIQAGVRAEQANVEGKLLTTGENFTKNYFALYPSVYFSKQFGSDEVLLSYSRRVDRPNNRQTNPYVNLNDSLNIMYGNPKLDPQFTNSYELGYTMMMGKVSLTTTGFLRATSGVISNITEVDNLGISRTTFKNVSSQNDIGAEVNTTLPILPFWRVNAGFSYYNTKFNADPANNLSAFNDYNWTAKINSNLAFGPGTGLQLALNYKSPAIVPQGKMSEQFSVDLGAKKDFLDGDLTVSFRVSDIFNTLSQKTELSGPGFTAVLDSRRESRVAFLGITYKLFNFKAPEKKRESGSDMDF